MNQQALEHSLPSVTIPIWTADVWDALNTLREQYHLDHDLFSRQEQLHLCFLRWLVQTGRLEP